MKCYQIMHHKIKQHVKDGNLQLFHLLFWQNKRKMLISFFPQVFFLEINR